MRKGIWALAALVILALAMHSSGGTSGAAGGAAGEPVKLVVLKQPLHDGRISPMLYGGFIELLDDLVTGMWAEMLGDRGFEGVLPASDWDYHLGALNLADRDWDKSASWDYDTTDPWNGARSAKLAAAPGKPATLTQGGLAVKKGMTYPFSGWFRTGAPATAVNVRLKALLPDGRWMILASAEVRVAGGRPWAKSSCVLTSNGATDRAVFELEADAPSPVWADKLSLMPGDNVSGWRRDVVDAAKELGPPVIRWGGSAVDPGGYKWKNGVGDRDLRTPFINRPWGRRESNDVGPEEFVQFCRVVGAEPLVCVSFADGPESARDMVEYFNGPADSAWGKKRAANGRPEPYGVKYWQVGNELESRDYAARCRAYCEAIKAADPAAKVLTSFPTPELMENVADLVDVICPHYYDSNLEWVESDIRRVRGLARTFGKGRKIGLGVTEWNIDAGNWGLGRGRLYTLGCALFEAQFLNILHRNADMIELACRSNLTNSFCGGTIQTNAAGLFRTPSFHVMAMFREHARPVALEVSGMPRGVDVTACASKDLSEVTVFVVNTTREPFEIDLDLGAFGPGAAVATAEFVGDTQDRKQIDAANGFDRPERIKRMKLDASGNRITIPALSAAAIDCRAAH